jgi:uncharacterized OsmC-like protein
VKITLLSDERIRLDGEAGPMTIEAPSPETTYSPFHMLASGLATCTLSVLHAWATNARVPADDLSIEVGWTFAEDPHRVGSMDVELIWPSLPENRRAAAQRVADLCTIKVTLKHPPEVRTEVRGAAKEAA